MHAVVSVLPWHGSHSCCIWLIRPQTIVHQGQNKEGPAISDNGHECKHTINEMAKQCCAVILAGLLYELNSINWRWFTSQNIYNIHMHVPEEVFQRDVSRERIRFIYFYDGRLFRSRSRGQAEVIGGVISAKVGPEQLVDLKTCIKYTLPNDKVNLRCNLTPF